MTEGAVVEVFLCHTFSAEGGCVRASFEEVPDLRPDFIVFQGFAISVNVVVRVTSPSLGFDFQACDCCGVEEVVYVKGKLVLL